MKFCEEVAGLKLFCLLLCVTFFSFLWFVCKQYKLHEVITECFFSCEQISGREVFEFRPELVDADDEEADDTHYVQGAGDDDEVKETGLNQKVLQLHSALKKCQFESPYNEINKVGS